MRNCPAYIETMIASFKGRYVHVNVNYRYRDNELHYILDNADAEAVVYDAEFREHVAALRPRLPQVRSWIEVASYFEQPADRAAHFAVCYDDIVGGLLAEVLEIQRAGDIARAETFIARYTDWRPELHGVVSQNIRNAIQYRYYLVSYAVVDAPVH